MLVSLFLTPIAIRYSFHLNAVDHPGGRKIHKRAVPRLGGAAMVLGLVLPLFFFVDMNRLMAGFLAGIAIVTITGLADDILQIPPAVKFLGEALAAVVFVRVGGISIEEFGDLFGTGDLYVGKIAPALTVFCMVGVMNALNLSDGLDGLAGGISAIACVFLGLLAYLGKDWVPVNILMALLGALFGFLRFNTYPANLFMGDAGSLLLGYTLSAAAVIIAQNDGMGIHLSPVTVAAVLALPITDTLLVMAHRVRRGEHPFYPDRSHLHHRLMDLGFPHAAVVTILYLSSSVFGAQAWFLHDKPDRVQFLAVIALAVVVHGGVYLLGRSGFRWKGREGRVMDRWGEDGNVYPWIAHVMGKSVRPAGWVICVGLALPVFAMSDVPRIYGGMALAMLAFVGALFPWRSRQPRSSICYGLIYLACYCILALLQAMPGKPSWIPAYLAALAAAVFVWVLLKMRYRGHREIVGVSAFETLLFGIALFVPLVLVPALGLGAGWRNMFLIVCMESAAFLLALKILIRRQPRRNYMIAVAFMVALALIGVRGLMFRGTVSSNVTAPASVPNGVSGFAIPSPPRSADHGLSAGKPFSHTPLGSNF